MTFELNIPSVLQRPLAILLALLPLIAVAAALYSYGADIAAHRERIALLRRERAGYEALLLEAPRWNADLARLRGMKSGGGLVFANRSVDTDAHQMQGEIATLLTAAGGSDVQSTVEVKADGDNRPIEIRATVTFAGNVSAIANALYRLKSARPMLVAGQISIHAAAPGQPELLRVDLVVSAFASAA